VASRQQGEEADDHHRLGRPDGIGAEGLGSPLPQDQDLKEGDGQGQHRARQGKHRDAQRIARGRAPREAGGERRRQGKHQEVEAIGMVIGHSRRGRKGEGQQQEGGEEGEARPVAGDPDGLAPKQQAQGEEDRQAHQRIGHPEAAGIAENQAEDEDGAGEGLVEEGDERGPSQSRAAVACQRPSGSKALRSSPARSARRSFQLVLMPRKCQ